MTLRESTPEKIAEAAAILRHGGLVIFPTETVYGLGADAANERAVARIFAAKGRPADHPLIVHVAQAEEIDRWAQDVPAVAWRIAARFWPGPLTLILKRGPSVSTGVTGGQESVGLRVPSHPVALQFLQAFGGGIAAPSANRFGRVSPTSRAHALAELGDVVECVLDGGSCQVGLESTILDLSGERPRLLRPGAVTSAALAEILGELPISSPTDGPRAPGRLPSHYAPDTPLRLIEETAIEPTIRALVDMGRSVAVLSARPPTSCGSGYRWLRMPPDPEAYGRVLYARLREIDTRLSDVALVERPPATSGWEPVHDRLSRAVGVDPQKPRA